MNVSLTGRVARWLLTELFVIAVSIYDFFWMLDKRFSRPTYEKAREIMLISAEWLLRFLSAKLDDYPEQKVLLIADLWNGSEPAFSKALLELRTAHFRMLQAKEDPRALDLVRKIPILPEGELDVDGLRAVLKRILETV